MNLKYSMSETEQEIMEVLWERETGMRTRELLNYFNDKGKNWKRQTLNTFLIRLADMQLVNREHALVTAAGTKADFLQDQTKELLDTMYGGNVINFCTALTGNTTISENDKKELEALIEKMKRK